MTQASFSPSHKSLTFDILGLGTIRSVCCFFLDLIYLIEKNMFV